MALNNRYEPSHPAGQVLQYGLDFANLLPDGVTLSSATLGQFLNSVPPTSTNDFVLGPVTVTGRRAYAQLSGGVAGNDYRLTWTAYDSLGNVIPRTVLLLCAATS